ncbi:MAG: tRNA uridine-5-carboxymethylaminomethyl(34) synthesis GTPase MnmE [Burkholderiales bacterium]
MPSANEVGARDTIAAVATPPGRGGIGIVRISGPATERIARAVMGGVPAPRQAELARFKDAHGEPIDEGLALFFPAPNSYTGEDVLELHGHGGPVVMRELLAACLDAGARVAEPGEFTRRAFFEGRLDLAQAEAVADLIDAASREAARSALRSLSGDFSAAITALQEKLIELRALTEAQLDFPEEEIDVVYRRESAERLASVRRALDDVFARSRQGSLLRTGLHTVLVGRPNVGKSSLLNKLAGEERAIVTPVPGTTRDALREPMEIDGLPLVLVDTAGLRTSGDELERLGMARTRRELDRADLVLAVHEAGNDAPIETPLPEGSSRIDIYNKIDLRPSFRAPSGAIAVSAKTGAGLDALRGAILRAAGWSATGETVFLARERHLRALSAAASHLERAASELERWELFAEELRLAHLELGRITGEFTSDDLLGEIFKRFCIGK